MGDWNVTFLTTSEPAFRGALTLLLAALWLVAILVLRFCYRRGGPGWSDFAGAKLDSSTSATVARLSGFSTEAAVATIGLCSLAGHVWLTRSLQFSQLPALPVVGAAVALAVVVPLAYCLWACSRPPESLVTTDEDRQAYAHGYAYYWIYGAVLLLAAGIEAMIVAAEWQSAAASAARHADSTKALLAMPGADAASPAVQTRIELALAAFDRFGRDVIDLVSAPLLPMIAVLVVLYLFIGGSGFHASFAGGGAALVYGLFALLAVATAAALAHGLTSYTTLAGELQARVQPVLDASRTLQVAEVVRRYLEIDARLDGAQGLQGFIRTLSDERGFYYGLFIAGQFLASQLVIVLTKRFGGNV